jgi:hypothetical protein
VYTVRFTSAVYVLHCFQKKSPSGIRTARDDVRLIDLGDAEKIDQAVGAFKKTVTNLIADRTGKKSLAAAQQVYQLVFAPLRKELGKVNDIFISPDGNLNLIPFEVLVDPKGHFLGSITLPDRTSSDVQYIRVVISRNVARRISHSQAHSTQSSHPPLLFTLFHWPLLSLYSKSIADTISIASISPFAPLVITTAAVPHCTEEHRRGKEMGRLAEERAAVYSAFGGAAWHQGRHHPPRS